MKIGFSMGRCLRDILDSKIDQKDVLLIIARTLMKDEEGLRLVIKQYHEMGSFYGHKLDKCIESALDLWKRGKIIEPRAAGIYASSVPKDYVWMDLFPTTVEVRSDAVKEAWEAYRMLIGLTEVLPEDNGYNGLTHGWRPDEVVEPTATDLEKKINRVKKEIDDNF